MRNVVTLTHLQEEVELSALAQDLVRLDKLSAAAWYLSKNIKEEIVNRVKSVCCICTRILKVCWRKLLFSPEGA